MLRDLEVIFETASICSFDDEELKYLSEVLTGMGSDEIRWEKIMTKHTDIIKGCVELIINHESDASIDALNLLINMSAEDKYAPEFLQFDWDLSEYKPDLFWSIFEVIFNSDNVVKVQKCVHLLCNITRPSPLLIFNEATLEINMDNIEHLIMASFHVNREKTLIDRDNGAMLLLNLSLNSVFREYLMKNLQHFKGLTTLIFLTPSDRWKFAAFGLIKNLAKFTEFHPQLIDGEHELLSAVLMPLLGEKPYGEEVGKNFPKKLKGISMAMEKNSEIRSILIDILYLFCATSDGRILLRDFNVYDVLKKYSEQDDITDIEYDNCLNVIGLLIRTEEEVACDDLTELKIPEDVAAKLTQEVNEEGACDDLSQLKLPAEKLNQEV